MDTAGETRIPEAELPPDVLETPPPVPPLTRSGILADLNDTGAVAASRFFDGFTFTGDARVRYEAFFDDTTRPGPGDRERGRFAVRLGFTKRVNPRVTAGVRLATGVAANPTSTFQSFDNAAVGKAISVDHLYLDLVPISAWPDFHAILGKQPNPFRTTSLVWDRDVSLEGVAETYRWKRWPWTVSFAAGQFFFEENAAPDDPYLLGEQIAFEYAPAGDLGGKYNLAAGLYHTIRPYGIDPTGQSGSNFAGPIHSPGAGFSVLDIAGGFTTRLAFLGDRPFQVNAGYIRNLSAAVNRATGSTEDDGWLAEAVLGRVSEPGTWEAGGGYRRVEADATLAQFTESEFSTRAGNTDIEGWTLRVSHGLWKNTTIGVSGFRASGESMRRIPDRDRIEANIAVKF